MLRSRLEARFHLEQETISPFFVELSNALMSTWMSGGAAKVWLPSTLMLDIAGALEACTTAAKVEDDRLEQLFREC